jgi:tetratricopeptide (TPR) repeat protein
VLDSYGNLLIGIGIGIAIIWALIVAMPQDKPPALTDLQIGYRKGDASSVERLLPNSDRNSRIALNVALGRYALALEVARENALLWTAGLTDPLTWLERINACEALVEVGRMTEAVEFLAPEPPEFPLLAAGRGCGLAWTLSCLGEHDRALKTLEAVTPQDLGADYCAEAFLTRALILMNLRRLDEARKTLDECRRLTARASTERNVLLLEARWQVMSGRIDEGMKTFAAARDHRWKCQGGSSLLALGDALRDAGRIEEARTCWGLAIERDAESHWAAQAKERLQPA